MAKEIPSVYNFSKYQVPETKTHGARVPAREGGGVNNQTKAWLALGSLVCIYYMGWFPFNGSSDEYEYRSPYGGYGSQPEAKGALKDYPYKYPEEDRTDRYNPMPDPSLAMTREIEALKSEREKLNRDVQNLGQDVEMRDRQLAEAQKDVQTLRSESNILREEARTFQEKFQDAERAIDRLKLSHSLDIERRNDTEKYLNERIARQQQEIARLEREHVKLEDQVTRLQARPKAEELATSERPEM